MCHQRWQTILNRGWNEVQPAEIGRLTLVRLRRCRTLLYLFEAHFTGWTFCRLRPVGACQRLSMVQRLWRFFANLRHTYRGAQDTNYLNLQPLRGCVYWGNCCYPYVADCASLIVNMGLLRLQPLRGCASGGIEYARHHRAVELWGRWL